jgi:hypothetical protein
MHLAEEYLVEKDSSGFQYVSYQPISSIYAIVRSWNNPREFTIEYDNGTSRTYTCAVRDTLLAMLLDISHAIGNVRVIVTGEVSDGLRLMPRFAEEDYKASLTDAFFGASSIEAWFLARLAKACKSSGVGNSVDEAGIELACKELNANVPCPGISPTSDATQVKACLRGVLMAIQSSLIAAIRNPRIDNSRSMALLLQTLYRLIPSVAGFKGFVEVREVDTRLLLLQLLQFDHDFVNYWTLQVLTSLCRCPLLPRNMQQEFVNKHTLLADQLLLCLIELMSSRIDTPSEDGEKGDGENGESNKSRSASVSGLEINVAVEDGANTPSPIPTPGINNTGSSFLISTGSENSTSSRPMSKRLNPVAPNPSAISHLPLLPAHFSVESRPNSISFRRRVPNSNDIPVGEETFFPNSLVVIAAAGLLESVVSSQRDTSSPELLHMVFDTMSDHCDALVHMLRSSSFLIMENAAILMFVLLKNRPKIAERLREMALAECLVLKNFYHAIFSPSATQRFISRFLIATWMTGSEKVNAAKAMLLRMIPTGLVEYLKHTPINEEQRRNLDDLEEEFYSSFGGSSKSKVKIHVLESI